MHLTTPNRYGNSFRVLSSKETTLSWLTYIVLFFFLFTGGRYVEGDFNQSKFNHNEVYMPLTPSTVLTEDIHR